MESVLPQQARGPPEELLQRLQRRVCNVEWRHSDTPEGVAEEEDPSEDTRGAKARKKHLDRLHSQRQNTSTWRAFLW